MSVTIANWLQYLEKAASSGDWICEVRRKDEKPVIEIIAKSDYEQFSRVTNIRKLSFEEMISCSRNVLAAVPQKFPQPLIDRVKTLKSDRNLQIADILHSVNVSSDRELNKTTAQLEVIISDAEKLQLIPKSLDKIFQRSRNKRLEEKAKSIWGEIKWYIWSWFYDQSSAIGDIKNVTPSAADCRKNAQEALQDRILMNIDYFEVAVKIDASERNLYEKAETREKFNTPNKVKKLWLTKYAEDKFPLAAYSEDIREQADTHRKRILAMLKIWGDIIRSDPNKAAEPNKAVDPAMNEGSAQDVD